MMFTEETPVPLEALPVAEFKAHLRLGTGFAEASVQEAVLESFLRAAIAAIEARTGKILIERLFSCRLVAWRDSSGQALPVAPVSEIGAVTMIDAQGGQDVLDPASYRLLVDMQRPRLMPQASTLPPIPHNGQVRIDFTAGYAAAWGALPADLGQAVLLLAAHYYEFRNETGLSGGCMPFGVTSLIERYRTVRLMAGSAT